MLSAVDLSTVDQLPRQAMFALMPHQSEYSSVCNINTIVLVLEQALREQGAVPLFRVI